MSRKFSLLLLPAAALLGGCATSFQDIGDNLMQDAKHSFSSYTETAPALGRQAIDIELINAKLTLATDSELAARHHQLKDFLLRQGSSYKQRVLILATPATLATQRQQLTNQLLRAGLTGRQLLFKADTEVNPSEITLISEYFVPVAPACNGNALGCATSRNLAMSVADPAQLLRGLYPAPADANKAIRALTSYREGTQDEKSSSLIDFIRER